MGLNFNTSLSGLLTSQKQMEIAQNNIANANTDGYARQRLEVSSNDALVGNGVESEIGSGVIANQVTRIKDEMLIGQVRSQQSQVGYYDNLSKTLQDVEVIFGDTDNNGLGNAITGFFNAWEEANKFPEEKSYRFALIGQAQALTNQLNTITTHLDETTANVDLQLDGKLTQVNSLTQKIARINEKIGNASTDNPNALFDERDRYLNELSQYVDITVLKDPNNPNLINVRSGGTYLVAGENASPIKKMEDSLTKEMILGVNNVQYKPKEGSLLADINLKNDFLPRYEKQINDLASVLISKVNSYHSTGYGTDGSTGNNFFLGSDARTIKLNPLLETSTEKIAISSNATSPGNSGQGELIAGITDELLFNGGTVNLQSFYNGFVVDMATDLNNATDQTDVHQNVLTGLEATKQSIQGVSVDEEMTNLMQFQHFYTANSKMIKATDDTFRQLFELI
jgi:flagellar hook-associated protein 1 FlgK